mgnify:FL=1
MGRNAGEEGLDGVCEPALVAFASKRVAESSPLAVRSGRLLKATSADLPPRALRKRFVGARVTSCLMEKGWKTRSKSETFARPGVTEAPGSASGLVCFEETTYQWQHE